MTRDTVLGNALREQLGKLQKKIDAARGRGSMCMVLGVSEAQFLLGLARITAEDVFSKPDDGGEQAGALRERAPNVGSDPDGVARPVPAVAGEEAARGGTPRHGPIHGLDPGLYRTDAMICGACLDGVPSECHTPGCAFFLCATPMTDLGNLRTRFEVFGLFRFVDSFGGKAGG